MTDRTDAFVWRSSLRRSLVIVGLSGFAISQPLLAVLGDNPATLAFHHVEPSELVRFAFLIAFVPPLLLIGIVFVAERINVLAGRLAHLAVVGGLATVAVDQWAKALGVPAGFVALLAAVAAGAAFTIAYVRFPAVTAWTSYTAFLPFLAVAAFLFTSPSSALLETASAPTRVGSDASPVVMIVLDELPTRSLVDDDAQLDATRFPHLAAFADDATWYRHHTTMTSYTEHAVPSLLTGSTPRDDPPVQTSYPDNLFTLLAPTHELEVMEVATHLCAYEECAPAGATTGPGFRDLLTLTRDVWLERVAPSDPGPTALDDFNETVDAEPVPTSLGGHELVPDDEEMHGTSVRADTFRGTFDADDPTTLYYLHLLLPHQPWRFYPDGTLYRDSDPLSLALPHDDLALSRSWSPWNSVVAEQRHLFQVQYVDALLGQIFDDLRAQDLYDDSLIVVTGDHGVSVEPRTHPRTISESTIDAIAYSPLFVKLPHQAEGAVSDANVMSIDVLPTIAEIVGVDVAFDVDGVPIGSSAIADRGDTKAYYDVAVDDGSAIEYSDTVEFATVPDRLLGPLLDPEHPLAPMYEHLAVQGVIGVPLDDLHPRDSGGTLALPALEELRRPDEVRVGATLGTVQDVPDGSVVLLAVDGTVVAGSEISISSDGVSRVTFLLPEGGLADDNDIRAVAITDGVARELELAG